MTKNLLVGILTLLLLSGIYSCKKDSGGPGSSSRDVKYEITGTYTGQLYIVTSDNININETYTVTSLPWTKSKTYASNVLAIGISGNSIIEHRGSPGQTVTLKIYSGGKVVRSGTVTCDENGIANLPTYAFTF